jgi:hypothetical protein
VAWTWASEPEGGEGIVDWAVSMKRLAVLYCSDKLVQMVNPCSLGITDLAGHTGLSIDVVVDVVVIFI